MVALAGIRKLILFSWKHNTVPARLPPGMLWLAFHIAVLRKHQIDHFTEHVPKTNLINRKQPT